MSKTMEIATSEPIAPKRPATNRRPNVRMTFRERPIPSCESEKSDKLSSNDSFRLQSSLMAGPINDPMDSPRI
jgi:hypothetical protein